MPINPYLDIKKKDVARSKFLRFAIITYCKLRKKGFFHMKNKVLMLTEPQWGQSDSRVRFLNRTLESNWTHCSTVAKKDIGTVRISLYKKNGDQNDLKLYL